MRHSVLALLLCLLLSSFTTPASPAPDAQKDVVAALNALVAEFNGRHDAKTIMGFFAPDAVLSHPNREANFQVIEESFARMATRRPAGAHVGVEVQDVKVSGDLAVLKLLWTSTVPETDGSRKVISREKDLEVWVKQGKAWKLWRGVAFPLPLTDKK